MIQHINPVDLTHDEIQMIESALDRDFSGTKVADVIGYAAQGDVQVIRVRVGNSKGVIITQVNIYPNLRELFIWLVAGSKIVPVRRQIDLALVKFAKERNCDILRTLTYPELARTIKGLGYRAHSICMLKEVE